MIEQIVRFKNQAVTYVFLRDGRFTICHGHINDPDRCMVGVAFLSEQEDYDKYDYFIGCKVALKRLCDNLRLARNERVYLQRKLDVNLRYVFYRDGYGTIFKDSEPIRKDENG